MNRPTRTFSSGNSGSDKEFEEKLFNEYKETLDAEQESINKAQESANKFQEEINKG